MENTYNIEPILEVFKTGTVVYYFPKSNTGVPDAIKVGIYIRVSTKLQEHKFSLKAQIQELVRYAKQMGWVILGIFRDVDSGGKLDKNGLNQLLDDVEEGKLDVVLCIDQDRLSRLDTIAWEYLKSQLRENSVKIAEPGKITDLADEDDEFFSDLKNLFARREKKKIVNRMMRGKRQRTREGKGWGKAVWEYDYDRNTGGYTLNTEWSWVIPFIDNLYLKEGLSDKLIARRLNEIKNTPTGRKWIAPTVTWRLNSKVYHGILEKTFANGETITVPDVFPALRSEETWYQIREKRKSKFRRKAPLYPHILRNILTTCGKCGRKLLLKQSGSYKNTVHFYYKHGMENADHYATTCGMSINSIRIENNLLQALSKVVLDENAAKPYIKLDYGIDDITEITKELELTNKLVQGIQQKADRLLELYLDGKYSKDKLNSTQVSLDNELNVHEKRKRELEEKRAAISANKLSYAAVHQYFNAVMRLDVLPIQAQMELIGHHFPSGILHEDRFVLQCSIDGVKIPMTIPVGPNPFAYMNIPGKKKPKRSTSTSTGIEIRKI